MRETILVVAKGNDYQDFPDDNLMHWRHFGCAFLRTPRFSGAGRMPALPAIDRLGRVAFLLGSYF